MTASRHFALIPAAGVGARMGSANPKQYTPLAGKPMLQHVLETFVSVSSIQHAYVVVSADDAFIDGLMQGAPHLDGRVSVLRHGGSMRHETVRNGLRAMREFVSHDDWVLVHDAARPGLTRCLVERLLVTLGSDPVGGLLALPVVDTLKRGNAQHRVQETVSREQLWSAQTPQMFRYALLCKALDAGQQVTDEASAVEALGLHPRLIEGSPRNFKVTMPHDVALAEMYLLGNP